MATKIGWTNETWNPVVGCSKVSEGCRNCYAMRVSDGLAKKPHTAEKYAGLTRIVNGRAEWTNVVRTCPDDLAKPLRWREPRMVFVNSMSDLFHPDVPEAFIADVFEVMKRAAQHTFQILTKRPERMAGVVSDMGVWLHNVWLGTSVEDGRVAGRIDDLRRTPAAVRFISFEPLIGGFDPLPDLGGIHWAILGGESGANRRDMPMGAFLPLAAHVLASNVALFVKQDSAFKSECQGRIPDEWWALKQFPGEAV